MKDAATPPRATTKDGKLYQRMGRSGENETNALEWIRSWKQFKMGEYPPELLVSLKDFVRVQYDLSKLLRDLNYESEVSTSRIHGHQRFLNEKNWLTSKVMRRFGAKGRCLPSGKEDNTP